MALDGYSGQGMSRQAMRAEMLDAETEAALAASGLAVTVLRNGWYTENYLGALPAVLEHGAVLVPACGAPVLVGALGGALIIVARVWFTTKLIPQSLK